MRRQRIELWTVETNEFTAHLLTSIGILPIVVQGARGTWFILSSAANLSNLSKSNSECRHRSYLRL